MERPILSIITVNLNNVDGLSRTIDSIINQTYKKFEFIVIDGASSDGSAELIKKHEKEFTFSVSEKDFGIYNAMNKGIQKSTGEYLLFLNSGDWLNNENVIKNISLFLKEHDVISANIDIYDKDKWYDIKSVDEITVEQLMKLSLYHQTTFISRKLFNNYGLYNEDFKLAGDYEFFIRVLLKHNATYNHINLKTTNFIADGISNDIKYIELNKTEAKKAWEINFSERVMLVFNKNQTFNNSTVYWLFQKTQTSFFYKKIFSFIHSSRIKLYRLFKNRK